MGAMPRFPILLATLGLLASACGGGDNIAGVDGGADTTAPETTLTVAPAALSNQDPARFVFESDREATFRCALDGAAAQTCASPYLVDVADGPHTLVVTAVSTAGIADPTPAQHTWTVDTVAPETMFVVAPALLDNSTTVRFEFQATEDATFTCALDAAAPIACTSPHVVDGLLDGPHTLTVTATDKAGNIESIAAVHAWTLDSSTPDTQIDTGPSGAVASRDAVFTFSTPDAGAGAVFECALDGGAWTACTSPYSLNHLLLIAHAFEVRVRDAAGNVDPTPAHRDWTIDVTTPTAAISGPTTTSDTTPTFTFTLSDDPTSVECRFDGDAFAPCTSPYTPAIALTEGDHTFEVRVADDAGNTSTASRSITIDSLAPIVEIAAVASPNKDSTPTFTFAVTGGASAVDCRFDAGMFAPCTSPYTPSVPLADGERTLEVRATDAAGNVGAATRTVTIDTIAPTVTIQSGVPEGGLTNDTTPTWTFTVSGDPVTLECWIGTGDIKPCTTATSYTVPYPLGDGESTLVIRATDAAGNSTVLYRHFEVDHTPPDVTITDFPSTPVVGGVAHFAWKAPDATHFECSIAALGTSPTTWVACTSPRDQDIPVFSGLQQTFLFYVRGYDLAGNVDEASRDFIAEH
jgi:hypothetical protein